MDTTRAIQAAVVLADMLICRARDSHWLFFIVTLGAGLLALALSHTVRRRCKKNDMG